MPGIRRCRLVILPETYVFTAAALLLIPLQYLLAWYIAAAVHELFHYIALKLCGYRVTCVRFGVGGAVMETQPLSVGHEIICAAAGPVGGGLLVLSAKFFPLIAFFAFIQTLYNLLPLYPLDGGRIFRQMICKVFTRNSTIVYSSFESLCLVAICCTAVYLTFRLSAGLLPIIFSLLLIVKNKNPLAKLATNRYNRRI